jgi:hypothetical protein
MHDYRQINTYRWDLCLACRGRARDLGFRRMAYGRRRGGKIDSCGQSGDKGLAIEMLDVIPSGRRPGELG